jgi:26S proteasome regulatory subunit T2
MSAVTPHARCRLKLLKLERIKDYLLMEEEFIRNQERLKPQEEKIEVIYCIYFYVFKLYI